MRISQMSKTFVASLIVWAATIVWTNAPGRATGLAAAENMPVSSPVISNQCMSGYCVALPLVADLVPEVDTPPCRWQYTPGQPFEISYRWTAWIYPGSPWRDAFDAGLVSWNWSFIWFDGLIQYNFDSNSSNTIGQVNDPSWPRGRTFQVCAGTQLVSVAMYGNEYWDDYNNYTYFQRRGIATHELGHGTGIGHIPDWYFTPALMYAHPSLDHFNNYYDPQTPDINLVNQVYP